MKVDCCKWKTPESRALSSPGNPRQTDSISTSTGPLPTPTSQSFFKAWKVYTNALQLYEYYTAINLTHFASGVTDLVTLLCLIQRVWTLFVFLLGDLNDIHQCDCPFKGCDARLNSMELNTVQRGSTYVHWLSYRPPNASVPDFSFLL